MNIDATTLLLVVIFAPAAAALLSLFIPRVHVGAYRSLATCSTLLSLVAMLMLAATTWSQPADSLLTMHWPWIPELGASFSLALDGTSRILLLLGTLVALAGVIGGRDIRTREREYYLLYQVVVSGALLALTAQDLLLFYIAYEIDVLCAFLMIACWGDMRDSDEKRSPVFAAVQLTLFLAGAAFCMLVAFWLLHHAGGGTFDLAMLHAQFAAEPLSFEKQWRLFALLLVGFGTMLTIWPFHPWAPLGYAAAPTGVSMLGGGLLKSLGAYGLIRVAVPLLPEGAAACAGIMAALAITNILYGGWVATRQTDWKLLIGYSSVSHMGYVLLGIASLSVMGATGAVILLVAHGLATACAYGLVGHLEAQGGSRRIAAVSGLARRMPFVGVVLVMTIMALCGLPGFAAFWGEILVFVSAWQQGSTLFRVATVAAVWGLVLTATYMLAAIRASLFGPARESAPDHNPVQDMQSPAFRAICLAILAALIVAGVWPRLVTDDLPASLQLNGFYERGVPPQ